MYDWIIINIGTLATPYGRAAKGGTAQGEISVLSNAYIAGTGDTIARVGTGAPPLAARQIDALGCLVTPGLIDAHTHLVFGGWREKELTLKLRGVGYLDILKAGGGILSTVRATREASEDALYEKAAAALSEMLALGVTACEAKSGYGLSAKDEIKQLTVAKRLNNAQPVELISTFMAAHAVPEEYARGRAGYVRLIIEEMLPQVARERLAECIDVFCETGVFSAQESREILAAGQRYGLKAKIHADEIDPIGGAELAGEIGALSAEHLIACTDAGIASLKRGGVIACLLPATSFYLSKPYARARDMIAAGVPVAIASDFNPGSCPSLNLQLAMNFACYGYRLTPEEVLTAATLNAAAAIARAETIGSVEEGKQADLVIWNAPDLEYLFYRFGSNLTRTVIKKGRAVYTTPA